MVAMTRTSFHNLSETFHAAQVLEEQRFPLHYRQSSFGADVAESQDARAIGDDRDAVGLVCVFVDQFPPFLNGSTGGGHAGRVPDGQVVQIADRALGDDLDFPLIEGMKPQRVLGRLVRTGQ
jgi:hypothetical protein